jgi:hypothetical protein
VVCGSDEATILPEAKSLLHGTHHADMPEGYPKFRSKNSLITVDRSQASKKKEEAMSKTTLLLLRRLSF